MSSPLVIPVGFCRELSVYVWEPEGSRRKHLYPCRHALHSLKGVNPAKGCFLPLACACANTRWPCVHAGLAQGFAGKTPVPRRRLCLLSHKGGITNKTKATPKQQVVDSQRKASRSNREMSGHLTRDHVKNHVFSPAEPRQRQGSRANRQPTDSPKGAAHTPTGTTSTAHATSHTPRKPAWLLGSLRIFNPIMRALVRAGAYVRAGARGGGRGWHGHAHAAGRP